MQHMRGAPNPVSSCFATPSSLPYAGSFFIPTTVWGGGGGGEWVCVGVCGGGYVGMCMSVGNMWW